MAVNADSVLTAIADTPVALAGFTGAVSVLRKRRDHARAPAEMLLPVFAAAVNFLPPLFPTGRPA